MSPQGGGARGSVGVASLHQVSWPEDGTSQARYVSITSWTGAARNPAPKLAGKKAWEFYLDVMEWGGNLPKMATSQDDSPAKSCFEWFHAMATKHEKVVLLPPESVAYTAHSPPLHCTVPDLGKRQQIGKMLQRLVIAQVVHVYTKNNMTVPPALAQGALPASGLKDHENKFKYLLVHLPPSKSQHFQQFRAMPQVQNFIQDLLGNNFQLSTLFSAVIPGYCPPEDGRKRTTSKKRNTHVNTDSGDPPLKKKRPTPAAYTGSS